MHMIHGHGGNVAALARQLNCEPAQIIDMSSNINPLGPLPGLIDHLKSQLHRVGVLPEVDNRTAVEMMAKVFGVDAGCLLAGHGTTQFIYTACRALNVRTAMVLGPTYADYADVCHAHGVMVRHWMAVPTDGFAVDMVRMNQAISNCDVVFICNPNNPTGCLIPGADLEQLCREHPDTHFIIDESYMPFVADGETHSLLGCALDNVSVLYSISKIFGVPGLRAGFLVANRSTIQRFERLAHPWSLNSLAQEAICYIGKKQIAVKDFIQQTRSYLSYERQKFMAFMSDCGRITLYPSVTSYILMRLPPNESADSICTALSHQRILVRNCSNFRGLSDQYIRMALKTPEMNRIAAARLAEFADKHSCD
jgi:threonine-phosphate decarboxylase